jgi:hypothetical protein
MRLEVDRTVGNRELEDGARSRPIQQPDLAAMGAHKFGGNSQAKSGSARSYGTLEWLEQSGARARRHAGTCIADAHDRDAAAPFALCPYAPDDRSIARFRYRLDCVAAEIQDYPEHLIWVGIQFNVRADPVLPVDEFVRRESKYVGHVINHAAQRKELPVRRFFLRAAIG